MSTETYEKLFRQVALKGNLLKASVAATLETNYTAVAIGATEMADRGVQFSKSAVDDSILSAGDRVVRIIGADPNSRYRKNFLDVTGIILSGDRIPELAVGGGNVIGEIGTVREFNTNDQMQEVSKQEIDAFLDLTLKQNLFYYYTDKVRIWHTRINPLGVRADVVAWNKAAQRALLTSNPRGACPFSEDLHECVIAGALSILFRGANNGEQAEQWNNRYEQSLTEAAAKAQGGN